MPLRSSSRCLANKYSNSRALLSEAAHLVRNSPMVSSFAWRVRFTRASKSPMICSSRCFASFCSSSARALSSDTRTFKRETSCCRDSASLSLAPVRRQSSSRCVSSDFSAAFCKESLSASRAAVRASASAMRLPSASSLLSRFLAVCYKSARSVSLPATCARTSSSCPDSRHACSAPSVLT